ncbi:sensor histidine kinase [Actinomadura scrupuli]|uniref:sensor histidine kinase n=1 Tax=Actinomadura scrupuli TaxID=559629 RepID=UPI003D96FAA1
MNAIEAIGSRPAVNGGRLTVQRCLMLVLGLMSVLVLVAALVGAALLNRTAQASDRLVDRIAPARIEASRLQAALLDQETGVRGYALTGDGQFLDPYNRGLAAERDASARLAGYVRGEPALAADLRKVLAAGETWRREYALIVIADVRAHGPKRVSDAATVRGKNDFDALRGQWTIQDRHLADARSAGRADLVHTRTVRDVAFAAMLAMFLLTGVLLAVLLHFMVARPLRSLGGASRRVSGGDFSHAISVRGPSDLRAVAADVEAMRSQIVRELGSATEREKLLQRQAAALDAQAIELRRSNSELEQFAYVASHDLQEPLRKVVSFCQMLERRYRGQLDERGIQYIAFAVDGAKRMQLLVADLLTFSRVGREQEHRTVPLDQALDRALENLETAVSESGATIDRPDRLPEVIGDPTLLTMLWQNLIGNAIKFRRPDQMPVVRVTCEPQAQGWRLSVTDNGVGIPAEHADKIFVIFQRLHPREAYSGTGIGLALCKKIVEHHRGRIWLDPAYTDGARIHFTIREFDEALATAAAPAVKELA